MTETVQDTVSILREEFHARMANFEAELKKSPAAATTTITTLASEFHSFRTFILNTLSILQTQVDSLYQTVDDLEMRGRRKILLVHGIDEAKDEDVAQTVVKVIRTQLKLDDFTASDVRRCHRMGRQSNATKPRPILCKFERVVVRDKAWSSKKHLKGSGVTLSEFLTKTRHAVFMAARQKFGVTKCWTRDGSIFAVGPDGTRHRITSHAEVKSLEAGSPKAATIAKGSSAPRTRRNVSKK